MGNQYIVWSGLTDGSGQHSVTQGILKYLCKTLIGWKQVSNQLLNKHGKMTITVAYAPTDNGDGNTKDTHYSLLQSAIKNISSPDISIGLTNANATIASSSHDIMSQP